MVEIFRTMQDTGGSCDATGARAGAFENVPRLVADARWPYFSKSIPKNF